MSVIPSNSDAITLTPECEEALFNAIHAGCPHSASVLGELVCQKFPDGDILPKAKLISKDKCPRLKALVINQLKDSSSRRGVGFLIVPDEENFGDATVYILGPNKIIFEGKLSEMFKTTAEHSFMILPSYRIFTANGSDLTMQAMKVILDRGYDLTPADAMNPFNALNDL